MAIEDLLVIIFGCIATGMLIALATLLLSWNAEGGPGWYRHRYEALAQQVTAGEHRGAAIDEAAVEAHREMLRAAVKARKQARR